MQEPAGVVLGKQSGSLRRQSLCWSPLHFFRQRGRKKVKKVALSFPQGQLHHTLTHPPRLKCSKLLRMGAYCRSPKEQETLEGTLSTAF